MNITSSVAAQIGGEIENLINENTEIQFYANSTIEEYQWRDSRFESTSDIWKNPRSETRSELIKVFKEHLSNINITWNTK